MAANVDRKYWCCSLPPGQRCTYSRYCTSPHSANSSSGSSLPSLGYVFEHEFQGHRAAAAFQPNQCTGLVSAPWNAAFDFAIPSGTVPISFLQDTDLAAYGYPALQRCVKLALGTPDPGQAICDLCAAAGVGWWVGRGDCVTSVFCSGFSATAGLCAPCQRVSADPQARRSMQRKASRLAQLAAAPDSQPYADVPNHHLTRAELIHKCKRRTGQVGALDKGVRNKTASVHTWKAKVR